jgi:hypothetical protein
MKLIGTTKLKQGVKFKMKKQNRQSPVKHYSKPFGRKA